MNRKSLTKFKNKYRTCIYLILIILFAFYFRTFNINWDGNCCMHPDERAIVMFTTPLMFPKTLADFLSTSSPLNPHFFAYGNFPLYLLKLLGEGASVINPIFKEYGGINIIGRLISAVADTGTVFFVFLIGSAIFSKRAGLFGALLYALSVFPIQTSHFYAVDPLLTFFMIITVYLLICFIRKPKIIHAAFIGMFFGLALATKISSVVLAISIAVAFILALIKSHSKSKIIKFILFALTLTFLTAVIFIITQPYTVIDFATFIQQTKLQSQMSNNAFLFPYTLQYVGKIPYLYELKNIFLWGQGPVISVLSFCGFILLLILVIKKKIENRHLIFFLLLSFLSYFLIFGKFAVGWMRYMLPIYPLLSVFGGFFVAEIIIPRIPKKYLTNYSLRKSLLLTFILVVLVYPVSFLSIYTRPNTRIQASEWIYKNVPPNSKIAREHWDDGLPIGGNVSYNIQELTIYDMGNPMIQDKIYHTVNQTDYIVIASNRLYVPLQRIAINCQTWHIPLERCPKNANEYYQKLFNGSLGFKKIAEFTSYPTIPFTNIKIVDDNADESFTVYDHPKIFIFKKD